MARQFYYAESLPRTTHTGDTAFVDQTTLTFTPDASSDYYLIWSGLVDYSSTGSEPRVRLYHDTASSVVQLGKPRMSLSGNRTSAGGIARYQSPSSPAPQTFSIEMAAESSSHIVGMSDGVIIAIKGDPADQFAASSSFATNSSSMVEALSLSWTPGSAGDYLILASATLTSNTNNVGGIELFDGTTSYQSANMRMQGVPDTTVFWCGMVRRNLSGAQNWRVRIRSDGSAVVTAGPIRILALRLDAGFEAQYYAESLGQSTTTSTTFQAKALLTDTPQNQDHLLLGVGMSSNNVSPNSGLFRLTEDGTNLRQDNDNVMTNSINLYCNFFVARKLTPSNASHTWATEFAISGGTQTAGFLDSTIALLQLSGGGPVPASLLLPQHPLRTHMRM